MYWAAGSGEGGRMRFELISRRRDQSNKCNNKHHVLLECQEAQKVIEKKFEKIFRSIKCNNQMYGTAIVEDGAATSNRS